MCRVCCVFCYTIVSVSVYRGVVNADVDVVSNNNSALMHKFNCVRLGCQRFASCIHDVNSEMVICAHPLAWPLLTDLVDAEV